MTGRDACWCKNKNTKTGPTSWSNFFTTLPDEGVASIDGVGSPELLWHVRETNAGTNSAWWNMFTTTDHSSEMCIDCCECKAVFSTSSVRRQTHSAGRADLRRQVIRSYNHQAVGSLDWKGVG